MKGTNYLQMIKEAKTSDEARNILIETDNIIPKVVRPIDNEYSNWTDEELYEYLDMLVKVESYYQEHYEEFHTPRELKALNELVH